MVMIKNRKLTNVGNSYGLLVPKTLVKYGLLDKNKSYNIIFEEIPTIVQQEKQVSTDGKGQNGQFVYLTRYLDKKDIPHYIEDGMVYML